MRAPRVRHLFIAALAIGAVAVLPASAGAHPEACANTGAFSGAPSAEWLAAWTSDSEGCMSAAAVNGFDDSDITGNDAWSRGFGVRIQMLLSDWLLADFEPLRR